MENIQVKGYKIMAKAFNTNVPLSLVDAFNRVIQYIRPMPNWRTAVGRAPNALNPSIVDKRSLSNKSAEIAATWLADKRLGETRTREWLDFRYLRKKEILHGIFDPQYWTQLSTNTVRAARCIPYCVPATSATEPAFYDPLRKQSYCNQYIVDEYYPLPPPGTPMPKPSPGWYGDVQSDYFADRWTVFQNSIFDIPPVVLDHYDTPIYFDIEAGFDFAATIRGNSYWPSAIFRSRSTFTFSATPGVGWKAPHHRWHRFAYKGPVPPDAAPYSWLVNRRYIMPIEWTAKDWPWTIQRYLSLQLFTVPPIGRYYSNNDSALAVINFAPKAYHAKAA